MKKKITIKTFTSFSTLLVLCLFLLLSPCKVRNFIQDELGIPQTETSNKSKTTFQSVCKEFGDANKKDTTEKSVKENFALNFQDSEVFRFSITSWKPNLALPTKQNQKVLPIPFYILYQHFKDYL